MHFVLQNFECDSRNWTSKSIRWQPFDLHLYILSLHFWNKRLSPSPPLEVYHFDDSKNHEIRFIRLTYSSWTYADPTDVPSQSHPNDIYPIYNNEIYHFPIFLHQLYRRSPFNSIKWSYSFIFTHKVYLSHFINRYLVTFVIKCVVLLTDCRDQTNLGISLLEKCGKFSGIARFFCHHLLITLFCLGLFFYWHFFFIYTDMHTYL